MKSITFILLVLVILLSELKADEYSKINIMRSSAKTEKGYYFLGSSQYKLAIVDLYGNFVKKPELENYHNGVAFTKQANGFYSYVNLKTEKWYILDQQLKLFDSVWANGMQTDFHDMQILPNGNYLVIGVDTRVIDVSDIFNLPKFFSTVIGFEIQEISSIDKSVVWRWNTFDHIPIEQTTDDNLKATGIIFYTHLNAITIDNDGNYLLSFRHLDEVIKIHRTTGNIIWRLGGTKSKSNQFTFINDTNLDGFYGFTHQHDPIRLENGNILLFDNGNGKPRPFSRAVEYQLDEVNMTAKKVWEYYREDSLYAPTKGNAQRLENGNTLIHWNNIITEVSQSGEVVHEFMLVDDDYSYRAYKFDSFMNYVTKSISTNNEYFFNEASQQTNVNAKINYVSGNGPKLLVEKHNYPHYNVLIDSSKADDNLFPLRYVFKTKNIDSLNATISISLNELDNYQTSDSLIVIYRKGEANGDFKEITSKIDKQNNEIQFNISGIAEIMIIKYSQLNPPVLNFPANNQSGIPVNSILKWNGVKGAESFRVVLESLPTNKVLLDTITKETYLSIYNLKNNSQYRWKVMSQNIGAISSYSSYSVFQTKIETPIATYPLEDAVNFHFKLDSIKWNKVSDAIAYNLEVSENENFAGNIFKFYDLTANYYASPSLVYDRQYFWRLAAKDNKSTSNWTQTRSFTTIERDPALLSPASNSVLDLTANRLQWKQKNLEDLYLIEIANDVNFEDIVYTKSGIDTNFVDIDSLQFNKQYFWRVRISNNIKASDWSNVWTFYTVLDNIEYIYPINDDIVKDKNVNFQWNKVQGALYYKIEISKSSKFEVLEHKDSVLSNSYEYDKFELGTKYYWRVRAYSTLSYSKLIQYKSFSTLSNIEIETSALVKPDNQAMISSNYILFEWTLDNNSKLNDIKYQFQLSRDKQFEHIVLDSLVSTKFIVNNKKLVNSNYYWRVKTVHLPTNNYSPWSEVWGFVINEIDEIDKAILIYPYDNAIIDTSFVEFVWDMPNYQSQYFLQVSDNQLFNVNMTEFELYTNKYKVSEFLANKNYFWRVATVVNSQKQWSDIFEFSTSDFGATSIEMEIPSYWTLDLEKNTLQYNSNEQIEIQSIYDFLAKKINFNYELSTNKIQLLEDYEATIFVVYKKQKKLFLAKFLK